MHNNNNGHNNIIIDDNTAWPMMVSPGFICVPLSEPHGRNCGIPSEFEDVVFEDVVFANHISDD